MLELSTDLGESGVESSVERCDIDSLADEDLELRTPKYVFSERIRLVGNSTVLTQRTLMRINYLLDAFMLPRT